MYYIVYKTTNLLNKKFYIGKHQCTSLDDGYLGSGVALQQAIKKYGKKNFKREILYIFDTELQMNQKERELVTEELVADPNCYNLTVGGEGGPAFLGKHHSEETKTLLREKGKSRKPKKRTEEQKQLMKEQRLQRNGGKWFTDETVQKLRQAAFKVHGNESGILKVRPIKSTEQKRLEKRTRMLGHTVSAETRKKLSEKLKGTVPSNKGKIKIFNENDNVHKFIFSEELKKYESAGWITVKKNK